MSFRSTSSASLAALIISLPMAGRDAVLAAYKAEQDAVLNSAMAAHAIRYADVLHTAYPGLDLDSALARKAAYRHAENAQFTFLADYERRLNSLIPLVTIPRTAYMDESTAGRYLPLTEKIELTPGLVSGEVLMHEAGHGLQHAAAIAAGRDHDSLDLHFQAVKDPRIPYRLRYLLRQTEFEVRLQALNRLYAAYHSGQPIYTPEEAVRALAMMDASITVAEIQAAFAANGETKTDAGCKALLHERSIRPWLPAQIESVFSDAFELIEAINLTEHAPQGVRQTLLEKIIFEAPGHL